MQRPGRLRAQPPAQVRHQPLVQSHDWMFLQAMKLSVRKFLSQSSALNSGQAEQSWEHESAQLPRGCSPSQAPRKNTDTNAIPRADRFAPSNGLRDRLSIKRRPPAKCGTARSQITDLSAQAM